MTDARLKELRQLIETSEWTDGDELKLYGLELCDEVYRLQFYEWLTKQGERKGPNAAVFSSIWTFGTIMLIGLSVWALIAWALGWL